LNKQLKKKRSSFAILGFLANGPKSGYEIKRAITERTSFFWNESFGQIYPMLGQLEGLGLIEKGEVESVGRRSSQRYAITPEGLILKLVELRSYLPPHLPARPPMIPIGYGGRAGRWGGRRMGSRQ